MHFVSEEEEEGKFWRVFSFPPPKEEKEKNTIKNTSCRNLQNNLLQKHVFKSSLQRREEEKEKKYRREKESNKGIPIYAALPDIIASMRPTCRASKFPSPTTSPAKSHPAEASGWWKLLLLHLALLLLECPSPPPSLIASQQQKM